MYIACLSDCCSKKNNNNCWQCVESSCITAVIATTEDKEGKNSVIKSQMVVFSFKFLNENF